LIAYQDCPECGARKIRESVSLCEVCEVSQRYEKRIAELQALIDLAKTMHDVAAKEHEEWEATAEKAPHEQADWHETMHGSYIVSTNSKEFTVSMKFLPPDGVWVRRVDNGWYVVSRDEYGLREAVYTDKEIPMGDLSAGLDSGEARALHEALWEHFQPYMRTKHRAGLVISVQPASSLQDE
jgi:hypothetical protein